MRATTDLGCSLTGAAVGHPGADMKANESFAARELLLKVAKGETSPLRGIQMPLTYFRKIVALTIVVVVDRRMFADQ